MIINPEFDEQNPDEMNQMPSLMNMIQMASEKINEEKVFYENFADKIPKEFLSRLGNQLKSLYEKDTENNRNRINLILNGLKALGLSNSSSDQNDESFTNPSYLKSFLSLSHESSTELFPPNNIVQASIKIPPQSLDDVDEQQQMVNQNQPQSPDPQQQAQPQQPDNSKRNERETINKVAALAESDLNYKLDEEWTDIVEEIEKAISASIISGSSVVSVEYNHSMNRPYVKNIPVEKIVMDAEATNLNSAMRISYSWTVSEKQLRDFLYSGYFSSFPGMEIYKDNLNTESNEVTELKQEIDGVNPSEESDYSFEYTYKFVTSQIFISLNEMDNQSKQERMKHKLLPYAITFHEQTGHIVRIVRMWDMKDKEQKKVNNLVCFKFLNWDGVWGTGLAHVAVPLARIATQLHRELTKSVRMANFPGGIIREDVRVDQTNLTLGQFQFVKVGTSEKLSDVIDRNLFNPPSPMAYELLKEFQASIESIAGITGLKMENIPSNIKSSALLAILEKEIKPQSAFMRRTQKSLNQVLKIIQRILTREMGEFPFGEYEMYFKGQVLTNKDIYGSHIQIRSSADPTLTNSAAQMIRIQAILEMAHAAPQLHKLDEIYRRAYNIMRVEDVNGILKSPSELAMEAQQAQEAASQQIDPNQVMMQEVQNNAQAQVQKHEIEKMKIQVKQAIESQKIAVESQDKQQEFMNEMQKDKIEQFRDINDILIKKAKTEAEIGRPIDIVPIQN